MNRAKQLVVDELVTRPSMVAPTLFVGLGGCGCRIVNRVATHLKNRKDFDERYRSLVKFALVDTNINDLESHRELADETFLISDFEKERYAALASGKEFLEEDEYFTQWVPQNYRFRAGDTAGAGQIRIESRLGCYYQMKHGSFVQRFRRLLEEMKSHEHGHRRLDTQEIRIVICYSVAGGTGSGAHLPIAYMLRDQVSELGKPFIIGVSVLPSVFEDRTGANKDGTFANGYAALKETEHLMKLGAPDSKFFPEDGIDFHYDPSDDSRRSVRTRPFEFLYVVDKPESFSVSDVEGSAADGLYLQLFSPIFKEQAGDYDNYTQHQRFLVPHDFEAKGIPGFSQFYGSYGAAVLHVPVTGLVDYCGRAAALSIMREQFLGDIPGEPVYARLRANNEPFYQVTEAKSDRQVKVADFHRRNKHDQEALHDRLFMKRVRLLAHCEYEESLERRFLPVFRHGERIGMIPKGEDRDPVFDDAESQSSVQRFQQHQMNWSINGVLLDALCGPERGGRAGLLSEAEAEVERAANRLRGQAISDETQPFSYYQQSARTWLHNLRSRGESVMLSSGYSIAEGSIEVPGLEDLDDLGAFLDRVAPQADFVARRYAALRLLEELSEDAHTGGRSRGGNRDADFSLDEYDPSDKVKSKESEEVVRRLMMKAVSQVQSELSVTFKEKLRPIVEQLNDLARAQRSLEHSFDAFEREQASRLERLREQGDESTNQWILDGEAFQIENGRRLWDFYFEDKVSPRQEYRAENEDIRKTLSVTMASLGVSGVGGRARPTLEKLFRNLSHYVSGRLQTDVGGDPQAREEADRHGLTLSDALHLEVIYRALYLSNHDKIIERGGPAIREVLARYNALPDEERLKVVDLSDDRHQDYLRDKMKRVANEKAELLCYYDDSRDQHGGVRPNKVKLAAIHSGFANSLIERALRDADGDIKWVSDGWQNPQQIIIYRAILNIPLYVFGRMDEMRDYYYRFKNLAKRSKVLHIDKNWEGSLPDLDPSSALEAHRQARVRAQIIDFATLLTTKDAESGAGWVVKSEGVFCLRDPNESWPPGGESAGSIGARELGTSISTSVEKLPDVLESDRVKYRGYQQLLRGVRLGLAPQLLKQIVELPFEWRKNRDELQTVYGTSPNPEQQQRLKDLADASQRMQEALESLLDDLLNLERERNTMGDSSQILIEGLSPADTQMNLKQSIRLLQNFKESWASMNNPENDRRVSGHFLDLFRPLNEDELQENVQRLRLGVGDDADEPEEAEVTETSTSNADLSGANFSD